MGRRPKNWQPKMEQQQIKINSQLPDTDQGDVIGLKLEITRVNNGFIVKGWKENDVEDIMVFNGENMHRSVASHVLNLALPDMKYGEVILYESKITYTKKIKQNGD